MEIKDGYNGEKLGIRFSPIAKGAELWIEFEHQPKKNETLSYMTLSELLELREELDKTIKAIINGRFK